MSRRGICDARPLGALRGFALIGMAAIVVNVQAEGVAGAVLQTLFSDHDVYLDLSNRRVTGWSTAQWHFRSDGSLTGYLFSSAYIGNRTPHNGVDNGNWWVSENRLCIQWSAWDGGTQHCYAVATRGDGYRASGNSGLLAGDFSLVK